MNANQALWEKGDFRPPECPASVAADGEAAACIE
jgi:hypothetical protein